MTKSRERFIEARQELYRHPEPKPEFVHRCEYCRHCGPTTTTNSGDGPIHKCWCRLDGIPGPLHDYYGKACNRWERTTRFDKEETR